MITTKEVKIKIDGKLSSDYIDNKLQNMGFDVLHWAITNSDGGYYTLNIAIVED